MSDTALRHRISYGTGSIATGIFAASPGLFLLFYLTDTLAVPAAIAGTALLLPRIWDVVTDPLMGLISDRTHTRWGRRRPYLLVGALAAPIAFFGIFASPDMGTPFANFLTVTGIYALAATAFTVFAIPYLAMPAEMTEIPHERTRVLSWRMAALVIGILLAGAVGPELIKLGGGGRDGYRLMAAFLAVMLFAAMMTCLIGTAGARTVARSQEAAPLRAQIRAVITNRQFIVLLVSYVLQTVAIGAMLASVPYFAKYTLRGNETTITILFLCLVLPSLLTMPIWVRLAAIAGKKTCYILSIVVFAAGAGALYGIDHEHGLIVYGIVAAMGCGYAGTQLFPFSILPDIIAADRAVSGETREGVFTGLWMASEKTATAIGGFFAATVLGVMGFVESSGAVVVEQPASALSAVLIVFTALPAALLLISLPALMMVSSRIGEDPA